MNRPIFVWVTLTSLCVATLISVFWLLEPAASSRLEAAVQSLALLGALTGIFAERRSAARERRELALRSIAGETRRALAVLADPRFRPADPTDAKATVYPRLPTSATETVLNSGILVGRRDEELVDLLHGWRDSAAEFNRRLDLTELRIFTARIQSEVPAFRQALHRPRGYLEGVHNRLLALNAHLATAYHRGSEVDVRATVRPRPVRRLHRLTRHALGRRLRVHTDGSGDPSRQVPSSRP